MANINWDLTTERAVSLPSLGCNGPMHDGSGPLQQALFWSIVSQLTRERAVLLGRPLLALLVLTSAQVSSSAENLLLDIASPITSQIPANTPQVPPVSVVPAPPAVQAPAPVSSIPPPDPFHSAPAAAPQTAGPVIYQGIPTPPPPGYTSGTICQNGICRLAPIPVQPAPSSPATTTPLYPPGYTGSTFAAPTAAPHGVNVDVTPTGRPTDLSNVRQGVLGALPSKP
jgi:hypothetical protein